MKYIVYDEKTENTIAETTYNKDIAEQVRDYYIAGFTEEEAENVIIIESEDC